MKTTLAQRSRPPRPVQRRHESPAYSASPVMLLTALGCIFGLGIVITGGHPIGITPASAIVGCLVMAAAAWLGHDWSDRRGDNSRRQKRQAAWTLKYDYRLVPVTA